MRVFIYAAAFNAAARRLHQTLRSSVNIEGCEYFSALDAFVARLRQPLGSSTLGILLPADSHELTMLTAVRHLLRDMRIILVLPDDHAQTLSDGHALRPRFVSYADGNLDDVQAVVRKIMGVHAPQAMQVVP